MALRLRVIRDGDDIYLCTALVLIAALTMPE
jgi:hypothetical protein